VYVEDALDAGPGDWGIVGVSLRSPDVRDRLAPQDGLYTLVERDASGERLRVIGCVREVLFAPEAPGVVVAQLADPAIRIVTLSVTEKGYCHDPATGRLDASHPDVRHDLAEPARPRGVPGVLVAGLARRRAARAGPLTVLCCDNLPHNGRLLRGLVETMAGLADPSLLPWLADQVAFPSTMVDRIVPATTPEDVAAVAARLGVEDRAPVVAEPFRQWVIEDRFAGPRPALEAAGVQLVADLAPFEAMKLRLLNGSHSALAYLGYLSGFTYVSDVVREPAFRAYVGRLMADEAAPTLRLPPGVDLAAYTASLLERFANPAIAHRTWQIAMDGSQKLPQRLLGTVRDNLSAGRPVTCLALAVAAWMRYVAGMDERGRPIDVRDPLAGRLAAMAAGAGGDPAALARAYLGVREVFGDDLAAAPAFSDQVARWLAALYRDGARAVVGRLAGA
jgi:fructuronate reductase